MLENKGMNQKKIHSFSFVLCTIKHGLFYIFYTFIFYVIFNVYYIYEKLYKITLFSILQFYSIEKNTFAI